MRGISANRHRTPDTPDLAAHGQSVSRKTIAEVPLTGLSSGGVMDHRGCRELINATGCDKVMLAREAMGNPWLFQEIFDPENYQAPTVADLADEIETHVLEMIDYYGLAMGLLVSRKVILDYMRGRGFPRVLKTKVIHIADTGDLKSFTAELRQGVSGRYCSWLKTNPDTARRLSV